MAEQVQELDRAPQHPRALLALLRRLRSQEGTPEASGLLDVRKSRVGGRVAWARGVGERGGPRLSNGRLVGSVRLSPLVEVVTERERESKMHLSVAVEKRNWGAVWAEKSKKVELTSRPLPRRPEAA